ncbi:variable surface protein Vir8g [Plasmodium vivax North Korean]|uniref:Variable surface protein Vir8g n=1 Tax=Plasmodium vivax North Korean TaxID=1035514 RepID=A0A0J9U293_PLAVI|nr:variable surface protein Vir8g [Plasmodium vivax North Korean]
MGDPARVQAIKEKLKQEYPFLTYTYVYDFETLRGMYEEGPYGWVCNNIVIPDTKENVNRNTCIQFFSYLHAILVKGALGDNETFMDKIVHWFHANKNNLKSIPDFMDSFNKTFEQNIRKSIMEGFNKFVNAGWNQTELEDIMKLYYFRLNAQIINRILMGDITTERYAQMCKFTNECVDIYRKYIKSRCAGTHYNANSGSSICFELQPFLDAYEQHVYIPTVPRRKGVISLKDDIENARVHCTVFESKYGYNPFGIFFKNKTSTLNSNGKIMVGGLSITAGMLLLFFLYKFTPLGNYFFPNSKKAKKRWRGQPGYYNEYFDSYGSGSDQYSQDSYTMASDDSFETGSGGSYNTRMQRPYDAQSAGTFDTQSTGSFDAQSTGTFNARSDRTRSSKSSRTFDAPSEASFDMGSTETFDTTSTGTYNTRSTRSSNSGSGSRSSRSRSTSGSRGFSAPSEQSFDMGSVDTFDTQSSVTFNTGSTGSLNSESDMEY